MCLGTDTLATNHSQGIGRNYLVHDTRGLQNIPYEFLNVLFSTHNKSGKVAQLERLLEMVMNFSIYYSIRGHS